MKKIISSVISLVILLGLFTACTSFQKPGNITGKGKTYSTAKGQDIREIAFNQLTSNDKERLLGTWQDSKIVKKALKEGMANTDDKSYIVKKVYAIEFTTKEKSFPNYIEVLLDIDNYKFIAYGMGE